MSSTHCSKHCTDTTTRRLKVWILIFDIWRLIFYLLPLPIWNYLYLVGKSWCKSRWRLVHTQDTQPTSLLLFWFTHRLKSVSQSVEQLNKWTQKFCKLFFFILFFDKLNQLKAPDQGWKADLILVFDGQQHGNYTYKLRKAFWRHCSMHRWTWKFHVRKQCSVL